MSSLSVAQKTEVITNKTVEEMTEAKVYLVIADETRNGLCEQMAVCVCVTLVQPEK